MFARQCLQTCGPQCDSFYLAGRMRWACSLCDERRWAQDKREQALAAEEAAGLSVGRVLTDDPQQGGQMAAVGRALPAALGAVDGQDDAIAVSSSEDDVPLDRPADTSCRRGTLQSMQVTAVIVVSPAATMLPRTQPPEHKW